MLWPIPDIPQKEGLTQLNYKRWVVALLIMVFTGVMVSFFIIKVTSYGQVFLFGFLPAGLIWLLFFGTAFARYESSVNSAASWQLEVKNVKREWQIWSQKQLAVLANIAMTPEEKGIHALLSEYHDIPAFPDKKRALFTSVKDNERRLELVEEQCEKKLPGYRFHLKAIRFICPEGYPDKYVSDWIYEIWGLYPEQCLLDEEFYNDDFDGLILLICVRDWFTGYPDKRYSEFITGQLISSPSFTLHDKNKVQAGIGRILSCKTLTDGLNTIIEYNQLNGGQLQYVWLSAMNYEQRAEFLQYAAMNNWQLPPRMPYRSLDFSFGPPGPQFVPVAISLLTDAAIVTEKMQLLIYQHAENEYSICLITRELLL